MSQEEKDKTTNTIYVKLKDCIMCSTAETHRYTEGINKLYNNISNINYNKPHSDIIINIVPYYDKDTYSIMLPIIMKDLVIKVPLTAAILHEVMRDIFKHDYAPMFWIAFISYNIAILIIMYLIGSLL